MKEENSIDTTDLIDSDSGADFAAVIDADGGYWSAEQGSLFEEVSDLLRNSWANLSTDIDVDNRNDELFDLELDGQVCDVEEELVNSLRNMTPSFTSLLLEEDFEFGFESRSEQIVREQLRVNGLVTRNWLSELFVRYYHDERLLIGLLRLVGRLPEEEIFPQGQTIAGTALNHRNNEIKELGVRAFENWGSQTSLNMLRNMHTGTKWLDEYISDVVSDLKVRLCLTSFAK